MKMKFIAEDARNLIEDIKYYLTDWTVSKVVDYLGNVANALLYLSEDTTALSNKVEDLERRIRDIENSDRKVG
jgi:polyhydroxyalkanoate synthesis regulator phasin